MTVHTAGQHELTRENWPIATPPDFSGVGYPVVAKVEYRTTLVELHVDASAY